jgi:hypothetical protein
MSSVASTPHPTPYSNTGVSPPSGSASATNPISPVTFASDPSGAVLCHFDYYRASVLAPLSRVVDVARRACGVDICAARGRFSYTHGGVFLVDEVEVGAVFWSPDRVPLVQASGVYGQRLFDGLSGIGRENVKLARADVCLDGACGAFESVDSVVHEVALARSVESSVFGDWDTPGSPSGRTRYVGSRQAFRFRRLYEFFKCHGYGAAWRYELEVKPSTGYKQAFGSMSASEILRSDDFSRRVLYRLGVDLSRLVVSVPAKPVSGDPFSSLVRQYWRILEAEFDKRGADAAQLGRDIMAAVDVVRKERACG